MEKRLHLMVVIILVFAIIASGCSSNKANTQNPEEREAAAAGETFPIVKNKTKLKFLVVQNPMIIDYKNNEFVKWYEEKTNIEIEWDVIPSDSATEKVNLILNSGDLPDAFFGVTFNEEQYAVSQQMFLPLDDMIPTYAPNFEKVMQKHDGLKGIITATDGKIYGLPSWNDCYHCSMSKKVWINKHWLEQLGLEEPKTTEEFYQVLKAFKEKDPNGNGKADEIPFAGAASGGWNTDPNLFLMNAFTYSSADDLKLIVKDSKIETIVNTPEYREGLSYIQRLYKEGLLYNPSYTQNNDQLRQLAANPDAEILGAFVSGANVNIIDEATVGPERYRHFVALAPLEGPKGVRYATHSKYDAAIPGSFYIPSTSKNPEAALRWADYLYTFEGAITKKVGLKGVGWEEAKPGDVGLNGKPALSKRLIPYAEEPQNHSLMHIGVDYAPEEFRFGEAVDPNVDPFTAEGLEKLLRDETKNKYEPYVPKTDALSVLPPIKFKANESQQIQTISVELANYVKESAVRFIMGDLNLDADWNKYVESLNNIGLEQYLETYQKAYDRQYKE
ncbi:ABC transporter substrate-binding protein [Cytobacillus firmus]|uniref:ABC transporter substrate-binding protein n=1 Tax=Paenibacillus lautus TaxID=1401 RepID=UPI003850A3A1|nr:ABC transporter substrate-binding protein [Cytobacillus firmus]